MIDYPAARLLVQDRLSLKGPPASGDEWIILDERTIGRDWGWVFFYDSRRYQETGESRFLVADNSPYLVRREDGSLFQTGTSYPIEEYIKDFEQGGRLTTRCT
jgi:hypothetical protein